MRIILLALLTSLSFGAQAQLWEVADQRNVEMRLEQALPVGGGRWAVIGRAAWAGSHVISVRNNDGSVAWEDVGYFSVEHGTGDVVLLPNSGLLHVGLGDNCDYYDGSRVRRYAPDGAVLLERTFTSGQITMAAKGSIAHVAVASQDSVYVMDMNGNAVGGFYVPTLDIQRILWEDDSTLFMVKGADLMRVDLGGTVLSTATIGSPVKDMHWDGQQLYVLANNGVHLFGAGLSPLGQAALPGVNWNSRFAVTDSSLYVNTPTGLYQVADDGNPSLLFIWPALPNLTTTGCAVRNGTVLAVGNTDISGRATGIIRTLSMAGDAVPHGQDVEVLVRVDSAWAEFVGGFYAWDRKADITGRVVNHGTDTLRSVVLSMWVHVPWILCGQFTNRIDTAGFALAPGDTLTLPFGVVNVRQGIPTPWAAGSDDICIVALAPDHLADRNPDDNTACETVDFSLGMPESGPLGALQLAPNPAHGHCTLSGLSDLGNDLHLQIRDLAGRIVLVQVVSPAANNVQLDVQTLPPTTYILSAEGKKGRAVARLVVEN